MRMRDVWGMDEGKPTEQDILATLEAISTD